MIGGMVMVGAIYLENSPVNLTMVTPLARLTGEYEIIVVPANSPHKNMADLVKAFKANPGGISWGGGSAGGTDHILVGLIAKATGVDPARSTTCRLKAAARRSRRSSADTSPPASPASVSLPNRSKAVACARSRCRAQRKSKDIPRSKNRPSTSSYPIGAASSARRASRTQQRDALIKIIHGATESAAWKDDSGKARLVADLSERRCL